MKDIDIISFDMFQTLVDVNQRIPEIWKGILEGQYDEELAYRGAREILSIFPSVYEEACTSFQTMEQVYIECSKRAFTKLGLSISPSKACHELMLQHGYAPFYEETLDVLHKLSNTYRIIISSDASHLMIDRIIEQLPYEACFISDDLGCYKANREGSFFQKVSDNLQMAQERILHIGDSRADVIGAKTAGMKSCFLYRDNKPWDKKHSMIKEVTPDIQIQNLTQLLPLLNL